MVDPDHLGGLVHFLGVLYPGSGCPQVGAGQGQAHVVQGLHFGKAGGLVCHVFDPDDAPHRMVWKPMTKDVVRLRRLDRAPGRKLDVTGKLYDAPFHTYGVALAVVIQAKLSVSKGSARVGIPAQHPVEVGSGFLEFHQLFVTGSRDPEATPISGGGV